MDKNLFSSKKLITGNSSSVEKKDKNNVTFDENAKASEKKKEYKGGKVTAIYDGKKFISTENQHLEGSQFHFIRLDNKNGSYLKARIFNSVPVEYLQMQGLSEKEIDNFRNYNLPNVPVKRKSDEQLISMGLNPDNVASRSMKSIVRRHRASDNIAPIKFAEIELDGVKQVCVVKKERFAVSDQKTINHINIQNKAGDVSVPIYGMIKKKDKYNDELKYIFMPLLKGISAYKFSQIFKNKPLSLADREKRERVIVKFLEKISKIHAKGIRHNDLHDENWFINEQGEIKVIDFEESKIIEGDPDEAKYEDIEQDVEDITSYLKSIYSYQEGGEEKLPPVIKKMIKIIINQEYQVPPDDILELFNYFNKVDAGHIDDTHINLSELALTLKEALPTTNLLYSGFVK